MRRLFFACWTYLIFLACCTPARELERAGRRIERITQRHPQLIQVQVDTITVVELDTIIRESVSTDTQFVNWRIGDTLILRDTVSKVEVRTIIGRDTVFQSITVEPDTLIVTDTVRIEHEFSNIFIQDNLVSRVLRKARRWWWLLIVGVCVGLLFKNIERVRKFLPF